MTTTVGRRTVPPRSRFADVSAGQARVIAAVVVLALGLTLYATTFAAPFPTDDGTGDLDAYDAIVRRIRDGAGYYGAAHAELAQRGYGLTSVFNWRTPLYPYLLALAPSLAFAQVVLAAVAAYAAHSAVVLLGRSAGSTARWVGAAVFGCALLSAVLPGTVLASEATVGVLILLSTASFGLGRWRLGVLSGLAALFVRELAAVYVVVALALALRRRAWREVVAWSSGLAAYAVYYAVHVVLVSRQIAAGDRSDDEGWFQLGGPGFVLRTAQVNGLWLILPLAVTAVLLVLALVGLSGWRDPAAPMILITALAYLGLFLVVGKTVNMYWGAIYTPLLAYGLALAPATLRDLLRRLDRDHPGSRRDDDAYPLAR